MLAQTGNLKALVAARQCRKTDREKKREGKEGMGSGDLRRPNEKKTQKPKKKGVEER